jgi:hypothetical protein
MGKHLVGLVALAVGCAQPKTTPLSDLAKDFGPTRMEIVAKAQLGITLHVDSTQGCPELADDATALFDGQTMNVARGGYDTNAKGCYPIGFWFDPVPDAALTGFEHSSTTAELVVRDSSATWQVDTTRLFMNTIINDPVTSTITWENVNEITGAQIAPLVPFTIQGNTIKYQAGTQITWIDASSNPVASRCDGPGQCTVMLEAQHNWQVNP